MSINNDLIDNVNSIFSSYKKKEYSRYMAVMKTANDLNMSMSDVGKILHPKGIKHKSNKEASHA